MTVEEPFDLSHFLADSLSLQNNLNSQTRMLSSSTFEDPCQKLFKTDPYEVLGINIPSQPKAISEDIIGTPIQEFFRGTNVLITGGTGFIGKILIDKLIRSVPHLGHIYLLIRSNKGKTSQERFNEVMSDNYLYQKMKAEVPGYRSKITAIDGDIFEPALGLSDADRQLLSDRVNVVFHSAANVRFIEPLRKAIAANVTGSMRVLELAKEMKNLKSYVHVSTAYSHCVNRVIEERVPKMSIHYKDVLKCLDTNPEDKFEEETPRFMQGWPNTYTFSKAICENMLEEETVGMPICIVRPSVVWHTYKEPVRGWSGNLNGSAGLMFGACLGVLHSYRLDNELTLDNVPVDYVVNFLIAAAWKTGSNKRTSEEIPVYNFTSTPVRQSSWKEIIDCNTAYRNKWPYQQAVWYNSITSTSSQTLDWILHLFLHRIPGYLFDLIALISGQSPRLSKIYKKIENSKPFLSYFVLNAWEFKNENVMALWWSLSEDDKQEFYFDIRDVDIKEHLMVGKLCTRCLWLKEPMETLPAAERKNTWLRWAHNSLQVVFWLALLKLASIVAHSLPL